MPTMMTIAPAKQKPDGVSAAAWEQIKKTGEITLHAITALDAVKLSKGGYVLQREVGAVNVGLSLKLEDMPNDQLKLIVLAAGKRIGKKMMTRTQLLALAHRCVSESIKIVDEDVEPDEPDVS